MFGEYQKIERDMIMKMADKRNEWLLDPVLFCEDVIGFGKPKLHSDEDPIILQDWQAEAIRDFAEIVRAKQAKAFHGDENLTDREKELSRKIGMSIMSSKGNGKTALAALVTWWFLTCFGHSRVPVIGPKYDQTKRNLWAEIALWFRHSVEVYGNNSLLKQIFESGADMFYCTHVLKESLKKHWISYILTFPKNADVEMQKAAIQGCHNPHLLFVMDECPGIPDTIFEPIESTLTQHINLVFAIFNPNKNTGWAIDTHRKMKDRWVTKHVDAYQSDIVSENHISYMKQKYGEKSNNFRVSVLGLPPLAEKDALIAWEWIQDAKDAWDNYMPGDEEPLILGCDIGGGGDPSVIAKRKGMKVLGFEDNSSPDTEIILNWIVRNILELEPDYVYICKNGIGHTISCMLERRYRGKVKGINVRRKAHDDLRYEMVRDELLWRLKNAFEKRDMAIPPKDSEFEGELSLLKYDDETSYSRIKVVSKKDSAYKKEMQGKLGYQSPNKVDAVALTFADNYVRHLERKFGGYQTFKKRATMSVDPSLDWMTR